MAETRTKFDQDFREGAVRLVRRTGKPIAQVAQDLGINFPGVKKAGRIGAIAVLGGTEGNSVDSMFDPSNISDTNEISGSQPGSH
jgi:transposase-like protein